MGRCSSSTTKPLMPEATTEGTVGPPCLLSHGLNLPTDGCRAATAHTAETPHSTYPSGSPQAGQVHYLPQAGSS